MDWYVVDIEIAADCKSNMGLVVIDDMMKIVGKIKNNSGGMLVLLGLLRTMENLRIPMVGIFV